MSSLPLPMPAARLRDVTDEELVDRVRAGDDTAFAVLHERYEARLLRYARRVLRGSHQLAEDVVQEALWRAHRALRRDDRPIALRPWLYRLVRNCCLDELARGRTDALDLHALGEEPQALDADPSVVAERRRRTRDLLGDLAALPSDQRHALLRREVDGVTHAALAAELDLTEQATRALVHRARRNLVKAAEARDASCLEVRADLDEAYDASRRASAHTYRHLATCRGCRSYRAQLRRVGATARMLAPLPGVLVVLGGAKLAGGGATKPLAGAAATAAVAGGALTTVVMPGDPSPLSAHTPVVAGGALLRGEPLPPGTAIVTRRVDAGVHGAAAAVHGAAAAPRGAAAPGERQPHRALARSERRSAPVAVRLACPAGTVVAELLPASPPSLSHGLAASTVPGSSRSATVRVASGTGTVRLLCKRPDARGSLLAAPLPFAAREVLSTCRARAYLRFAPGGRISGSTFRSQPLDVVERSGGWVRVRADDGATGWLPRQSLCASSRR